jgi:hypothetical protein
LAGSKIQAQLADVIANRTAVLVPEYPAKVDGMNADGAGDLIENQALGKAIVKEFSHLGKPVWCSTLLDAILATHSLREQLQDKSFHR